MGRSSGPKGTKRSASPRLRLVPALPSKSSEAPHLGRSSAAALDAVSRTRPATAAGRKTPLIRSEEHTSELQSLMRISYAVFCLKKTTKHKSNNIQHRSKHERNNID